MIIINDKNYENYDVDITFGKYISSSNEKTKEFMAPFISFKIQNYILELDLAYDKKWFQELNLEEIKDISNYVSGLLYIEKDDITALNIKQCKLDIKRIEKNVFNIDFSCEAVEPYGNENYNISIKDNVKINY